MNIDDDFHAHVTPVMESTLSTLLCIESIPGKKFYFLH